MCRAGRQHPSTGGASGSEPIRTKSRPTLLRLEAELTGLTPGAVTGLVDRLLRRGYVQRTPDPADRRRVLIAVDTEAGPEFADAFTGLSQAMADLVAKYDDAELAAITDYITNSIEILHAETRRLSAPDGDSDDAQ